MRCPLQCGQCCDYWRGVLALIGDAPRQNMCPHLGRRGCKLARRDRPVECAEYMCGVAMAVVDGRIDHDMGVLMKERGYTEVPYRTRPRKEARRG